MVRTSYQKGTLQWHRGQWSLIYRTKDASGHWVQKRESEAFEEFQDRNDKKGTRRKADSFMAAVNEQNNNPRLKKSKRIDSALTFESFLKGKWASYLAKRKMEPSTLASYESIINKHLVPAFGSRPLIEITPGILTDFFDGLRGKVRGKTARNVYGLLNVMFDVALDNELIESKPLRDKVHKPEFERAEKPTIPADSIRSIIAGLPTRDRLVIAVLSVFTVRAGEALGLRWQNWDSQARVLSLTHSLWRGKLKASMKTRASKRKFEVPDALAVAIEAHRVASEFNGPDDFIFCNQTGGPLDPDNFRNRVLYPIMDSLGIERGHRTHGFHAFRHTAATELHRQTGDIEKSQRALGHARRSTTEDYYDHAEVVVDQQTTQTLLDALIGQDGLSIQSSGSIN